jgi:hypothetical protein
MADIELINLVTTRLVQKKKEVEYNLKTMVGDSTPTPYMVDKVDVAIRTLGEYNEVINNIRLWESLLDEITNNIPEENKKGDNNN